MKNRSVTPARNPRATAASVALLAALAVNSASAQITWSGATDNDWLTGSNWGGAVPGATDTARFDSVRANNAPSLTADTTVRRVEFLAGAGAYTISGSRLTLDRSGQTGAAIENNSGAVQTFTNPITLSSTENNRSLAAGAGSTLTFTNTITMARPSGSADTHLVLSGAGTINLAGLSGFNQLQQTGSLTVNINTAVPANGGVNGVFSTNGDGRINLNANSARWVSMGSSSSGNGRIFLATAGVSVATAEFRGGNNTTSTFGADIAGGGTATTLGITNNSATRTGATYIISAAAGNTLNVDGVVSGSGGAGTKYQIQGPGVVRFSGATANTSSLPLEVFSGRLELNKPAGIDAIGGGSVSILSGAELRLLAANQIADSVGMTLAGGTFHVNGHSETLGGLTLAAATTSFIDFGAGASTLLFSSIAGTGNLTVSNWTQGSDSFRFTADPSAFLGQISINGLGASATDMGGYWEITAIPEPSAFAALAGLGALGLAASRRRRR
jgi:hypothetical protein